MMHREKETYEQPTVTVVTLHVENPLLASSTTATRDGFGDGGDSEWNKP